MLDKNAAIRHITFYIHDPHAQFRRNCRFFRIETCNHFFQCNASLGETVSQPKPKVVTGNIFHPDLLCSMASGNELDEKILRIFCRPFPGLSKEVYDMDSLEELYLER
jgi:hypothetical protein